MSAFSELLSEEIKLHDISAMKISVLTGISRSSITKILSGQKVPTQSELSSIISLMPLPLSSMHRLMTELDNIRFGSSTCAQLDSLLKKLGSFPAVCENDTASDADLSSVKDIELLQTSEQVHRYIAAYLEHEASLPHALVYSNITLENKAIQDKIIRTLSRAEGDCDFRLCVLLKRNEKEQGLDNFSTLFDWAPFFLKQCSIFYDYTAEKSTSMPFGYVHFIILSRVVILINESFTNALVISKPDIVENLRLSCEKRMLGMKNLIRRCNTAFEMFDTMKRISSKCSGFSYLQYYPCVLPFLEYAHFQEGAKMDIPQVRAILPELYKYYSSRKGDDNRGAFTLSGLIEFAKTGIISEIPREYTNPLSPGTRRAALMQILHEMKNGSDFRVINDNFSSISQNAIVDLIDSSRLMFTWFSDKDDVFAGQISSVTNEIYLLKEAEKFFDALFQSRYLYTKEQSEDIIIRCMNEIK